MGIRVLKVYFLQVSMRRKNEFCTLKNSRPHNKAETCLCTYLGTIYVTPFSFIYFFSRFYLQKFVLQPCRRRLHISLSHGKQMRIKNKIKIDLDIGKKLVWNLVFTYRRVMFAGNILFKIAKSCTLH